MSTSTDSFVRVTSLIRRLRMATSRRPPQVGGWGAAGRRPSDKRIHDD